MLERVRDTWSLPVLVSTHPRTRKRLDELADVRSTGIAFHEPFGFPDYVRLQEQRFCVLSDSGTISEESAILGFPAVTLRDSIERPEALDSGAIVLAGLDPASVVEAVRTVVRQRDAGEIAGRASRVQDHELLAAGRELHRLRGAPAPRLGRHPARWPGWG